jgi:endonuclease/exonuclease/phosphatase family metal-dependent hydrolase
MKLKFFNLNMYHGRFLDRVVEFLKKEDFDVIQFQEVAAGKESYTGRNCFEEVKNQLGYQGEMAVCWGRINDKGSYAGNATFFKKSLGREKKEIVVLKEYEEIEGLKSIPMEDIPRSVLSLLIDGVYFINAHLAWGPTPKDADYKLAQNKKLFDYIKSLDRPFVLSGDFNLTPDSQVVGWFNSLADNLIAKNNVLNTLNPRTHRVTHLFPPGLAVDYIFAHKSLKTNNFRLIDTPDLSDHLGLSLEIEI